MDKIHVLLSVGNEDNKLALLPFIQVTTENKHITFYATEKTHNFLSNNNIESTLVYKISETEKTPNISEFLSSRTFDYIINIPSKDLSEKDADYTDGEIIRRTAAEYNLIAITDLDVAEIILGNLGNK